MHAYFHHIGDFNNATRHLTRIERSIYRDLLELYYDTESPIPNDLKTICRKVMAVGNIETKAVDDVLKEFFFLDEESFRHFRCDEEIKVYLGITKDRSKAGKASAKARKAKKAAKLLRSKENTELTSVEHVLDFVGTNEEQTVNKPATNAQQTATNQKPVTSNHLPKESVKEKVDQTDNGRKFQMGEGWEPIQPRFDDNLYLSGVEPSRYTRAALQQFRMHFADDGKHLTESAWQSKLINWVKNNREQDEVKQKGTFSELNDRTWAQGMEESAPIFDDETRQDFIEVDKG